MLAEPADWPVTVLPETVATEVLDEEKLPPVKPEEAEAVEVLPTVIVEEVKDTEPAGQTPCTVTAPMVCEPAQMLLPEGLLLVPVT